MPKDAAAALQRTGQWCPAQCPPPPAATWDTLAPDKAAGG